MTKEVPFEDDVKKKIMNSRQKKNVLTYQEFEEVLFVNSFNSARGQNDYLKLNYCM